MHFNVLDIPDTNAELAGWLERELVGLRLGDVVAVLQAFRSSGGPLPAVDAILGDRRAAVLSSGLTVLTDSQLRSLLGHPRLLLALQEHVLVEGGPYWRNLELTPEHRQLVADCWTDVSVAATPAAARPSTGGGIASRRSPWAKVLTAAAILLVGFFGWRQFQSPPAAPSGWGWDRPGALSANVPAKEYLEQLANGANDWFKKRPDDAATLRTRLVQFRHGCDALLAAPHAPLTPTDRDWLIERCGVWRGKIDEHIAALDQGAAPLDVRTAADATVNKLLTALRDRASTVG